MDLFTMAFFLGSPSQFGKFGPSPIVLASLLLGQSPLFVFPIVHNHLGESGPNDADRQGNDQKACDDEDGADNTAHGRQRIHIAVPNCCECDNCEPHAIRNGIEERFLRIAVNGRYHICIGIRIPGAPFDVEHNGAEKDDGHGEVVHQHEEDEGGALHGLGEEHAKSEEARQLYQPRQPQKAKHVLSLQSATAWNIIGNH
mmetsp:Transcript_18638/g.30646  ORF Transcript_18638/g.30646 Transcript_18638/m.30646 type:complete len:200 (+) Transcript_18638:1005-1604(+)